MQLSPKTTNHYPRCLHHTLSSNIQTLYTEPQNKKDGKMEKLSNNYDPRI